MRRLTATLLLVASIAAQEDDAEGVRGTDASVADAARWTGPRGSASGNLASRALPIVTEVEEAWRLEFEAVEAPPVHWDGTGYVVVRVGEKPHLVAFDLTSGREIARSALRGFHVRAGVSVWNHLVYLQPDEKQVSAYRLVGRRLEIAFTLRGQTIGGDLVYPRMPVVHDNEIYVVLGRSLARYRPGPSFPTWENRLEAPWGARIHPARPCVYGPHVFVAYFVEPEKRARDEKRFGFGPGAGLFVAAFQRSNGNRVASTQIADGYPGRAEPDLEAAIAGSCLYLRSPWFLRPLELKRSNGVLATFKVGKEVQFAPPRQWDCATLPSHHGSRGAIVLAGGRGEWCLHRGDSLFSFADEGDQPDLFGDRVAPTVLGDIAYFGSWAADLETGEIVWRLPVTKVTFPAVAADRLVLVVDKGRDLRAFRGRGSAR